MKNKGIPTWVWIVIGSLVVIGIIIWTVAQNVEYKF